MKRFEAVHFDTDSEYGWEVRPADDADPYPVFQFFNEDGAKAQVRACHSRGFRLRAWSVSNLGDGLRYLRRMWRRAKWPFYVTASALSKARESSAHFWGDIATRSDRNYNRHEYAASYERVRRTMTAKEWKCYLASERSKVA